MLNRTEKLNPILATMLIISLTLYYFIFVANTAITYAIDMVKTNSHNVDFSAYFVNENGEKVENISKNIESTEYLYVDIEVKNEGYFDGQIEIKNGNFRVLEDILSSYVSEISENIVKLKQINSGNKVTIKLAIEAIKNDQIKISNLNKKTNIALTGNYLNSKNIEKRDNIDVTGNTYIGINWISNDNITANLNANILTNYVYNDNKIIQILVESNITSNSYPVKNTEINLTVPNNVQSIKVHSRENNATNSNAIFDETNYTYSETEKMLKINLANEDENLISWNKDVKDVFVVTYVFEKNMVINENIIINSTITTYDNKALTANKTINIDNENIDGIVSFGIDNEEEFIYKGKIYTGEERDYLETIKLNVDYIDGINEIKFNADESKYYTENKESTANIFYKEVKISRNKFINLFGNEGVITFKTLNGEEVAKVTGTSEQNENGDIVITFSNEIRELLFITSKPINVGEIKFNVTKKIINTEYEREIVKEIKGIETNYVGSYNEKDIFNVKKDIELKDTESIAKLTVNEKTFFEEDANKKVKITATLLNNDESKDLYKDPEINIKLPNELNINSAKCKLLYGNGLKIESAILNNDKENNSIKVKLSGKQSEYNTEIVEGTKIVIDADVTVKNIIQDIEDKVIMNYSNEYSTIFKDNGIQEKNIKMVASANEENDENITNEKIKNLKSSLKAYVGGEEIKDGDKVYAGEIITYELKLENIGEEAIENLEIEAIIPENTTLITYNPNYPGYDNESQEYTYSEEFYKELSETEKKDIITIENNKDVTLSYSVKIKTDLESELEGKFNLKIKKDNESLKEYIISNIFSHAELGILIRPLDRIANSDLTYNVSYSYLLEVSNFTDRELTNLNVVLNINDVIDIVNITQLNTDRDYSTLDMNIADNSFVIDSISSNETKKIQIVYQVKKDTKNEATISTQINEYKSNSLSEKIIDNDAKVNLNIIESSTTTSVQRNNYVSIGDSITYTIILKNTGTIYLENLRIQNQFSDYLDIKDIKFNGGNIEYNLVDNFENNANYSILTLYTSLDISEEATIVLTGKVRSNLPDESDLVVINKSEVYKDEKIIGQTDDIMYYIKRVAELEKVDDENLIDNQNESPEPNDENETKNDGKTNEQKSETHSISGVAWFDENKNGKRDTEEKYLRGIEVTIINLENNSSKIAITDEAGEYKFDDLDNGKYIEIFEYDTEKYELTIYRADNVTDKFNSDVENTVLMIGNTEKNVAATDTLLIEDENQENIDIGLIEAKTFDLKLDKTISKLTVSNAEGTKVQEYNDVTLAQKQIRAKYISGTTVVVEYKIKVTNVGEIAGYARQIVDNKPNDLVFNSKLNSDWYQSGDKLYSTALANTKLEQGESKELKLILTKTMTETNLGLTHNTAEITESYNPRGIKDKDSTSENKNEIGSADLIISVSTGGAITYISITLSLIVLIAFGAYIVLNKIVV